MAKQTIRSKWAYWEELKDRQAQPPIVDNDLIVYQDWTKTAGSTVSNNNESDVQPLDKNYDPNVDLNPAYLSQMDMNTPIKWANQSFSEYWDDSSRDKQSTPWGENAKYTWENTKNSDVAYNPDIKTGDLNPYYVYGRTSQVYGTMHPWYISQRNDNIASALYNEWKRSKEEVEQFLSQQQWWMDSSELDRQNTIESIWKRIWDIAKKEREIPVAPDLTEDTSGKIYWKTTAEEWNPKNWIDTLADANSVLTSMQAWRTEKLQEFLNLDPAVIATCINEWTVTWDEQTWRDAEQYNPEFIAEVKAEQKKQLTQKNMNAMTDWNYDYVTTDMEAKKKWLESSVDSMAKGYSNSTTESDNIKKDIEDAVAKDQTASEASDTMAKIEEEAAILKNRLKNLKSEAQAAFKWDVPDYLVKAYINNKTQEIQNQLSILEDRYNAAYTRYTTQLNEKWKEKEFSLKQDQLDLQRQQQNFNQWYQKQTLNQSKNNYVTDDSGNVWKLNINEDWSVYYEKVEKVEQHAGSWMKGKWLKNNNPWNIKDNDFWNVIWHDSNGFAIFLTPEDWFDALVEKIKYNQTNPNSRYYWTTIREYFQIYAPSSDWNNPDAYAKSVAKQLWVSIDTPIKDLDPVKFAAVIAKHDSGYDYSTYWQFRESADWNDTSFDINSIEVPQSVYETWNKTIDPNSEEWKKLAQEYREKKAKEMWYDITSWELVADADWKNTAAYKIISADDGTPISFRQRIYNLVPATLKNSEVELENLYKTAKILYKAWYSADEASMVFYGLDPRNDKTWLLRPLINIARASWRKLDDTFYGRLWSLLESGNSKQAVLLVENSIMSDSQVAKEESAVSTVDKIQQLEALLQKAESLVWPIDKPLNKLITDWYWNEKYAYLAAQIDNIYWEVRNALLWSNITEWEQDLYTWMFPEMSDQVSTIKQKLKATKKSLITNVNAIRRRYDLPLLNQYTLVDYDLRAELYNQDSANI